MLLRKKCFFLFVKNHYVLKTLPSGPAGWGISIFRPFRYGSMNGHWEPPYIKWYTAGYPPPKRQKWRRRCMIGASPTTGAELERSKHTTGMRLPKAGRRKAYSEVIPCSAPEQRMPFRQCSPRSGDKRRCYRNRRAQSPYRAPSLFLRPPYGALRRSQGSPPSGSRARF